MYNKISKKTLLINLIFLIINSIIFSQKINDDTDFKRLLVLSKEANNEYFKSNYYSIQIFSGKYDEADSIYNFLKEKYKNDSIYLFFETPNYKVHIGRFKNIVKVQKKLRIIIKDFNAAFILKPN
tara:strand:- start:903 stop:1277 length:375 start_codon:yes stop_codon:yes gene_type:complete